MTTLWDSMAEAAAAESLLWKAALRPPEQRELLPVFSSLASARFGLAVETIYEGYLLHYGRPRLFETLDADIAVLLGDYLYAHGLVRLAELRDVDAVADLAELISLCTQLRAEPTAEGHGVGRRHRLGCNGGRARAERRTPRERPGDASPRG